MFIQKAASILLRIVLPVCCLSVSAQQRAQWVDDLYFTFYSDPGSTSIFIIDENNFIRRSIPTLTSITEFPVPKQFRTRAPGAFWHNDGVFMLGLGAFEKNEDGTQFQRNIFAV